MENVKFKHGDKFQYNGAESREKLIAKLESQLSLKIINCIKSHLCKQDEDYDKAVISPKFLSDALDQMVMDGFEEEECT